MLPRDGGGNEKVYAPPLMKKYFTQEMMSKYPALKEAMQKVLDTKGEDDEVWADFCTHYNKFKDFECFSNWDGKKYDVVFYGVSGYTGYLMMEYLKRVALKNKSQEPFTFAFAGRTVAKVKAMRDREFAGTPWADTPVLQASFDDIFSLIDLAKSAHVIINVAGPYMLTQGELLIDACIQVGTHYVDISGEIPWTLRVLDLHQYALKKGVHVITSAASAGGFPDLGVYMCAKKLREEFGEETRYAAAYCSGGGAEATASGGTLKTRAAMADAGDEARKKMGDPFALGGFIPDVDRWGIKNVNVQFGTGKTTPKPRQEDLDMNFSKVTEDKKLGVWRGPFVYSFLDTRIVRRTNMLLADLGNRPYGRKLNFMEYALLPAEHVEAFKESLKKGKSVEEEKKQLQESGKYYKEGEGPPLEELESAWVGYFLHCESENGHEVKCSFVGRDGYFETARIAVETAMCLRFDRERLAFKGGCLTTTAACGECLLKRLVNSGCKFKMDDWLPESERCPPPFSD
eukprot:TRINITY_DN31141_c0_g1_i1.p1 TRINITY_DN31141_c0_g1~~TRINITY_DN31141_c0_g1_i1.p1  ORF type:complete len:561 (-),score=128.92 TRINITY_DN31141_c0_g1_i1:152-1696(-)